MSPIGENSGVYNGPAKSVAVRGRDSQKLKAASDLRGDFHDQPSPQQDFRKQAATSEVTCSGTEAAVPFRHAGRLTAPFVAQLLGQLLPDCERPRTGAAGAYDATRVSASLLLDARL